MTKIRIDQSQEQHEQRLWFLDTDEKLSFKELAPSFLPNEFWEMVSKEPDLARYTDICGTDGGLAFKFLKWRFSDVPLPVGIFDVHDVLIAIGYATPINYAPRTSAGEYGMNLTYAVAKQHEGRGLAMLATCLAIDAAANQWPEITGRVNIQTKAQNSSSLALAKKLKIEADAEAGFTLVRNDGTNVEYLGFRGPWLATVALARQHLQSLDAKQSSSDHDDEIEEALNDEALCTPNS